MDRDRLKEVHQTDLTENRVNEDFIDWLKNKGPTWLLVVLIAICGYLGIVRFKQSKVNYRANAWGELFAADLPGSYEDVAREYGDVGQLGNLARLRASETLLLAVQRGTIVGAALAPTSIGGAPATTQPAGPEDETLSPEERTQYLTRADGHFDDIIATDTQELNITLYIVSAMNGKASIAECRRDDAAARDWYLKAAGRAEAFYPGLAEQARARAETVGSFSGEITFPSRSDVDAMRTLAPTPKPITIDDALRDLVLPEETGS